MPNPECIPINSRKATPFETSLFKGHVSMNIRGVSGAESDPWAAGERFHGKKRKVVLTVQGHFKRRVLRSEVKCGMVWKSALTNLPWSFVLNAAENVILAFSPGATSNLSSPTGPGFMNYLLAGVDSMHVAEGGEDRFDMLSSITPEKSEFATPKKRMEHVRKLGEKQKQKKPAKVEKEKEGSNRLSNTYSGMAATQPVLKVPIGSETTKLLADSDDEEWGYWEPGDEYTFDFYGDKIDLARFVAHIPTLPEINLNKYFNGQPFPFVATTTSGEVLWHFEVWHSLLFEEGNSTYSPEQCGMAGSSSSSSFSSDLSKNLNRRASKENLSSEQTGSHQGNEGWSFPSCPEQYNPEDIRFDESSLGGTQRMKRALSFQSCQTDGAPSLGYAAFQGSRHSGALSQSEGMQTPLSYTTGQHPAPRYPKSPALCPRSSNCYLSSEDVLDYHNNEPRTVVYGGGRSRSGSGNRLPHGGANDSIAGGRGMLRFKNPVPLRDRWLSWDEHLGGGASQPRPTDYFCASLVALFGIGFFVLCLVWYHDTLADRIRQKTIELRPSTMECIKILGITAGTLVVAFLIGRITEFIKAPYLREPSTKGRPLLGLNMADSTFVVLAILLSIPEELCFRGVMIPTKQQEHDPHARVMWAVLSIVMYVGHFPLVATTVFPRGYPTLVDPRFLALASCVGIGSCLVIAEVETVWACAFLNGVCTLCWLVAGGGLKRLRKVRIRIPFSHTTIIRGEDEFSNDFASATGRESDSFNGSMHTAPSERYHNMADDTMSALQGEAE